MTIQVIRPPGVGGQTRPLPIGAGSVLHTWTSGSASVPSGPPPTTSPPPISGTAPTPAAASLEVSLNGPDAAKVGADVQFEIEVVNRGGSSATGLLVSDRFDLGLDHAAATSPIERDLADLPPGGAARFNVNFRVSRPGQLCQDITVTGDGGLRGVARRCIVASQSAAEASPAPATQPPTEQQPETQPQRPAETPTPATGAGLVVRQTGPARQRVGETALFTIEVTNQSQQPIQGIQIANNFETTLRPLARPRVRAGSPAGRWVGKSSGWSLARHYAARSSSPACAKRHAVAIV